MVRYIVYQLLKRRHFWRYATFSEVAELYVSRTMRIFAMRMAAAFVSVYLLKEGHPPAAVAAIFVAFYGYKVIASWPLASIVAKYGPKKATFVSNILLVAAFPLLSFSEAGGLWLLAGWLVLQASSICLYDLSYLVSFSKVKHSDHAGKEIGFMTILEKSANAVGPLAGGFLALWIGPETMMLVASGILLLAAVPLLRTPENLRINQTISFHGFPWRQVRRSLVAESGVGMDVFISGTAWSFVMVLIVFAGGGDEVYAKVGVLFSLGVIATVLASYVFGKLIDNRRGGELLSISVVANACLHLVRPFVTTPVGLGLVNVVNEVVASGYSMPFLRGIFDTADRSGNRLAYILMIEITVNVGAALAALLLALFLLIWPPLLALIIYFWVGAAATLIIGLHGFALYKK